MAMAGFGQLQTDTLRQWFDQSMQQSLSQFKQFELAETTAAIAQGSADLEFKIGDVLTQANSISGQMHAELTAHRAEFVANSARVDQLVRDATALKDESDQIKSDIVELLRQCKVEMGSQEAKAADLNARLETLTSQMDSYAQRAAAEQVGMQEASTKAVENVERLRRDTQDWASGFQARLESAGLLAGGRGSTRGPTSTRRRLPSGRSPRR